MRAIRQLLDVLPEGAVRELAARAATREELTLVHDPEHVERVAATAGRERYAFDADTPTSRESYEAARRAAGGALALADAVVAGEVANGFAFVRPPGHHAERDRAMGFCLFNNVAVVAAYLRRRHGIGRVLVVDWDVHHGNGTQHAFYGDPSILFVSSHQFPFYPGTGDADEVGIGDGEGFTLNLPFPAGYGDEQYVRAYLDVVEPVAREFAPEFIVVSAGFDAHRRDPLAGMQVTEEGFANLARILVRTAGDVCDGRLIAILEGGYDLIGLTRSVAAVLGEMAGSRPERHVSPPPGGKPPEIRRTLEIARHYWRV